MRDFQNLLDPVIFYDFEKNCIKIIKVEKTKSFLNQDLFDNKQQEKTKEKEFKNLTSKNSQNSFNDFINTNKKICENIGKNL